MAPLEQQQQQPVDGPLLGSISRAVVRIIHDHTGRGPTKARTSIRDDVLVVMLEETLLKGELSLIRGDKRNQVVETRRAYQETMRDDLSAAVEMLTERKVIAFMSDSNLEPDYSVELFVLAPPEI